MTSTRKRAVRDALLGPMFGLLAFAWQQYSLGNLYVAAMGLAGAGVAFAVYRYADAQLIQAAVDAGDVEDVKPVLKRLGRIVRDRVTREQ